jgi:hypothetical protein
VCPLRPPLRPLRLKDKKSAIIPQICVICVLFQS